MLRSAAGARGLIDTSTPDEGVGEDLTPKSRNYFNQEEDSSKEAMQ